MDELKDLRPSEVAIEGLIQANDKRGVALFKALVRGRRCVIKVYVVYPTKMFLRADGVERRPFESERLAYRTLKRKGLCQRGIVPDFYGTMEPIDPAQFRPHLDIFLQHEEPPNAVILRYIPNMKTLAFSTYTKAGAAQLRHALTEIHKAGVTHDDIHPRNMIMLSKGPVPAMWIDFDSSETYSENGIMTATGVADPDRQRRGLKMENGLLDELLRDTARYFKDGTPLDPLTGMREDPREFPDFGSDFEDGRDEEEIPDLVQSTSDSSSPKSKASQSVDGQQSSDESVFSKDNVRVRKSSGATDTDYDAELEHRPKKRRLDEVRQPSDEAKTL